MKLTVTDPLDGDVAYLYLFRRSGTLAPGAGREYVNYTFNAHVGRVQDDLQAHRRTEPRDLEGHDRLLHAGSSTTAGSTTASSIKNGTANGPDILDRHKALFAPGVCGRSEDTFDDGEGAFLANINGPVRAIRSYIGANSGPYTERTHIFYAQREDIVTDLRVHPIPA